jgi:hypothetical protein
VVVTGEARGEARGGDIAVPDWAHGVTGRAVMR